MEITAIYIKENGTEHLYYTATDHLGSICQIIEPNGTVVEQTNYDPCSMNFVFVENAKTNTLNELIPTFCREGRPRNTTNWTYTNAQALNTTYRGYTGHEHLSHFGGIEGGFALINMNGRIYDPVLGRMLSPDNYVQDPYNPQNYNRYAYVLNNPLKYTDPSGEFWVPIIIGAVIGMYIGGEIANQGEMNPFNWEYSSVKTWGYMLGGSIVGGLSGSVGAAIAASEIPMANTVAIIVGSTINSVGTHIYTGGATDISVAYGVGSYNITSGEHRGIWNWKELSNMERVGYSMGAFINASDIYGAIMGAYGTNVENVELQSDNHSSIYDKDGNSLLDVGAKKPRSEITAKEAISGDLEITVDYRNYQTSIGENIESSIWNRRQPINNLRLDKLAEYGTQLANSGKGYGLFRLFGGRNINCSGGATIGLLKSGVLNVPIAVPGLLSLQMYARQFSYLSYYTVIY